MSDMIKNDEELEEERLEEERKAHLEDLENGVSTDEETISDTESHLTESFMSRPMSGTRMSTEHRVHFNQFECRIIIADQLIQT